MSTGHGRDADQGGTKTQRQAATGVFLAGVWGMRWQFMVLTTKEGKVTPVRLFKVADLPIIRHIKVRDTAHAYNPFYADYFEQRHNRQWLRRKKYRRFLAVPAIERVV